MHQAAKKGARPVEAPGFDDEEADTVPDNDDDDDEREELAEALRMVKLQQDFGGLELGQAEIAGFA